MLKLKSLPILARAVVAALALAGLLVQSNPCVQAGVLNIGNGATGNNPLGANAPHLGKRKRVRHESGFVGDSNPQ